MMRNATTWNSRAMARTIGLKAAVTPISRPDKQAEQREDDDTGRHRPAVAGGDPGMIQIANQSDAMPTRKLTMPRRMRASGLGATPRPA
jgi:hypothetical protein